MAWAGVTSSLATVTWWYFVNKARKDAYAEFHKNLDTDKMFQRQLDAGIFTFTKKIEEAGN
jgi:transaldolase